MNGELRGMEGRGKIHQAPGMVARETVFFVTLDLGNGISAMTPKVQQTKKKT